tara:strand:+ start:269 stop:457 length:189 start_codon:yes stop_codon:yes gene_type:complete
MRPSFEIGQSKFLSKKKSNPFKKNLAIANQISYTVNMLAAESAAAYRQELISIATLQTENDS